MSGSLKVTIGRHPVFVKALVVPTFKDNLTRVGKYTKANNILFTVKGMYLQPKDAPNSSPTLIGRRGSDNLYKLPNISDIGQSSLHATSEIISDRPITPSDAKYLGLHKTLNYANLKSVTLFDTKQLGLHETLNHANNSKPFQEFRKIFSKSSQIIIDNLEEEKKDVGKV